MGRQLSVKQGRIDTWHVLWETSGRSQSEEVVTGPGYESSEKWTTRDPLDVTPGIPTLSQNCQIRLLASSCLPVCPSVRMEQLASQWTDFHEILYLKVFSNLSRKFKFHLNPTRIRVLYMKRTYIYDSISLNSS